jgi:hypothetical protein
MGFRCRLVISAVFCRPPQRRGNLGEVDAYGGAFCELTLNGDVTAALANNSIASSEAKPAAVTIIFRGKERFEKMLFHLPGSSPCRYRSR